MLGSPGGGGMGPGHGMGAGGPGGGGGGLKGGILGMSLAMNGTVLGGPPRFGAGRGQQQQPGPFGNGPNGMQGYGGPPGMGGGGGGGSVAGTPNGGSYGTPGGGGGLAALAGGGGAANADPRALARMEAEAKKEAYRRELEEQIRARQAAKDAEVRRRREEEEQWEARARQAPPPWDPAARAHRRGGGGEPLRDDFGRPVADLRARPGRGSPGGGMAPSPGGTCVQGTGRGWASRSVSFTPCRLSWSCIERRDSGFCHTLAWYRVLKFRTPLLPQASRPRRARSSG